MKVSTEIRRESLKSSPVKVLVRFLEENVVLHTVTVFVDDPEGTLGTELIKWQAIRHAREEIDEMSRVVFEAGQTENERRASEMES